METSENNFIEKLKILSQDQLEELQNYLDNNLFYSLSEFLNKHNLSEYLDKIISINNSDNSKLSNLLHGGNEKNSLIMKGLNATIFAILNRKFDKNRIDYNLVEGARERKIIYAKRLLARNPNDPVGLKLLEENSKPIGETTVL